MKKLLEGILEFRSDRREEYLPIFSNLALGQKPDTLYIGCSDSRVAVNVFASTRPGDLLVVRNVGNLIPPIEQNGISTYGNSEWAAVEFAVSVLKVKHIIVCGHSECGAIRAAIEGVPHDCKNLQHRIPPQAELEEKCKQFYFEPQLSPLNRLSQANVLQQIENLQTSSLIASYLPKGLKLHAWWFDIANVDVYYFAPEKRAYSLLDAATIPQLLLDL